MIGSGSVYVQVRPVEGLYLGGLRIRVSLGGPYNVQGGGRMVMLMSILATTSASLQRLRNLCSVYIGEFRLGHCIRGAESKVELMRRGAR